MSNGGAEPENEPREIAAKTASSPKRRRAPWVIGFLAGISALAALVLFIAHVGDITVFAKQAANAKAGPLIAAIACQTFTYFLVAFVWYLFLRQAGAPLKLASLVPLSLAKLFADQAIPSGGVSGAAFFLFALTRRGVRDKIAFRTFAYTTTAYFGAFLVAAIVSLAALANAKNAPPALAASVSIFAAIMLTLALAALLAILYKPAAAPEWFNKSRLAAKLADFAGAALRDIRHLPGLFARLTLLLLVVRVVDGFTVTLIAVAIDAPIPVFTGIVAVAIASIAATIGPVPMGLGTFEAGMIASLTAFGIRVEDALTITLVYRGLSLWAPLLPGFAIIQREFLRGAATPLEPPEIDADQT